MHIPQTSVASTVVPATTLDASLHNFIGVSWHILMPYTLLGAGLMLYSQYRLAKGEKALAEASSPKKRSPKKKTPTFRGYLKFIQYKPLVELFKAS